jgi:hypothetical protein
VGLLALALASACTARDPGAGAGGARRDGGPPASQPASAATPGRACRVTATAMWFLPRPDGRVDVVLRGRGFMPRAVPLGGRLGRQPLHHLTPTSGRDTAAAAIIDRLPRSGDRLSLGYLDEAPCDTGLSYEGPVPPR